MSKNLGIVRQVEEGNTDTSSTKKKQPTRRSFYAFTAFPKNEDDINSLKGRLSLISKRFLFGREVCPTTHKEHLQGFFALKKAMRITELKLPCNPHVEATIADEEANVKYCSKDGNVFMYGFPKPIQVIEQLRPWQQEIENIILQEPDPRKIYWYWEHSGNVGKTSFVKYAVLKHNALFCDGGKKADLVNLVFNNDMENCNCIFWDIPRCNQGKISYSALESIKNGLVCNTKYETGVKVFNSPHIIVFANSPPDCPELLSEDRWEIHEIMSNNDN